MKSPKKAPKSKVSTDNGTLVRINKKDKEILQTMAAIEGEPMPKILHKALETYRRQKFLDQVNQAYETLKSDPDAWQVEQTERDMWSSTYVDGSTDEK